MSAIAALRRWTGRFARDRKASAAVEFALVAPVMLAMFLGSVEMTDLAIANRKVTTLASTAADLVAQDVEITNAEMADIFAALEAVLQPLPAASARVTISSVVADANGVTRVAWSDSRNGAALAANGRYTLPTGLVTPGSSVIVAEVRFTFQSRLGFFVTTDRQITETFMLRPRRVLSVTRIRT